MKVPGRDGTSAAVAPRVKVRATAAAADDNEGEAAVEISQGGREPSTVTWFRGQPSRWGGWRLIGLPTTIYQANRRRDPRSYQGRRDPQQIQQMLFPFTSLSSGPKPSQTPKHRHGGRRKDTGPQRGYPITVAAAPSANAPRNDSPSNTKRQHRENCYAFTIDRVLQNPITFTKIEWRWLERRGRAPV